MILIRREWAERVANQIKAQGGRSIATYADVTSYEMVGRALATFNRVDILITIPAYMGYQHFAHCCPDEMSPDEMHRIVDVTFWGVINSVEAVIKSMMAQRSGSIVCMGSDSARMAPPGESMYAASKAAIMTFASCLAKEVGSFGVRINVVNAVLVDTPGNKGLAVGFAGNYPLGRLADPREVAEAIVFLALERASFITGQSLSVNVGRL